MKCPNCNQVCKTKGKGPKKEYSVVYCSNCNLGFTWPRPKDVSKYYHENYWISPGWLGIMKKYVNHIFQKRRIHWIKYFVEKGQILDVGAGEGEFGKLLGDKYKVINIDIPKAKIQNKNVIKVDFLKWNSGKTFEAVVFWESLEHSFWPRKYLKKVASLLKKDGYIFIEYPRYDCWESKIFGKYWFHQDLPRHLSHLTRCGLEKILYKVNLKPIEHKNVAALEYNIFGFTSSILACIGISLLDSLKKTKKSYVFILLIPLLLISSIVEVFFLVMNESPTELIVAQKPSEES